MDTIKITVTFFQKAKATWEQTINMTEEAYNYMISTPVKGEHWKQMSNRAKVAVHLEMIKSDLHAEGFSFVIYE